MENSRFCQQPQPVLNEAFFEKKKNVSIQTTGVTYVWDTEAVEYGRSCKPDNGMNSLQRQCLRPIAS